MGPSASATNDISSQWGNVQWATGVQPTSADVFLHSDLAELVASGLIVPFLDAHAEPLRGTSGDEAAHVLMPRTQRADGRLDTASFGVLQLQAATNIAQPLAQRVQLQALAAVAASDGVEGTTGRSARRLAKLLLSDGRHAMVALERSRCPALDAACFGAKIKLHGVVQVRCGVLLLHPSNVSVLGGVVRALQAHWDTVLRRMAKALEGSPGEQLESVARRLEPTPSAGSNQAIGQRTAQPLNDVEEQHSRPASVAPQSAATSAAAAHVSAVAASPTPAPSALVVDAVLVEVRGNLSVLPDGTYSLPVQLQVLHVVDGDPRAVVGGHLDADLGHPWMRFLMGMGCDDFTHLSELAASGGNPGAEQQLQDVVDRVSTFLERYGEGRFALEHCEGNARGGVQWVVVGEQQRQPS